MASAHDVGKYVLEKRGSMTTWKLQKLVYYSKAWHLVWEGEPLFPEHIEAWANGPVVRTSTTSTASSTRGQPGPRERSAV